MDVCTAFVGKDGGLRTPLMYNGVVLGVLAAWKTESGGKGADGGHNWEEKDKAVLEKVPPPYLYHSDSILRTHYACYGYTHIHYLQPGPCITSTHTRWQVVWPLLPLLTRNVTWGD